MSALSIRDHLEMETEGERSPIQRREPYVEVAAAEYRVPGAGAASREPDPARPHVAGARREACVTSHAGDDELGLAGSGIPGVEFRTDRARAEEPIPALMRRQAD